MIETLVLTIIQLLFGRLVKQWPALASLPNKLIPVVNFILAILIKLAEPALANAAGLGSVVHGVSNVLFSALVQTVLTTGLHSSSKNLWQSVKEQAAKKISGE